MKKKLLATLLVCAMLTSLLASCSGGEDASSTASSASSATVSSELESSEPESSEAVSSEAEEESSEAVSSDAASSEAPSQAPSTAPESSSESQSAPSGSSSSGVAVSTIAEAVKAAYGEAYLPSMELTPEDLEARYGLKADDYDEAFGQVAMISTQVDTFVAVKAKDGKADVVVSALNAYRDDLVNNSMQYPMNLPKVNASQVYQNGNYVFFLMLGDMASEDVMSDEAKAVAFYEEQNQIAVEAINAALAG